MGVPRFTPYNNCLWEAHVPWGRTTEAARAKHSGTPLLPRLAG